uniref:RRM domain-containing protein n=1 Tax=Strongyloides papillosus TaxID=174720 RepID=A0A0N5CEX8_STREA
MHCVVSWNNEKGETVGDAVRVFKDTEGYWDFESVTDESEYWNMKSNSEMSDFQEYSNAQDYITFREYRSGIYGDINIEYSYCAPVVSEDGFNNNQFINQNFMPTYLGGSSMPMYMPYGGMFMPPVLSPLIPVPIFIGGSLIGWRRNNLFFGRRFMPGFGGANFIRRGLWNSMDYGLRTRRYGSPMGSMFMDNQFDGRRNMLPPIGFSTDSRMNGFGSRRRGRNGPRGSIEFGRSRIREHNRFGSRRNDRFGGRRPGLVRPNRNFNSNSIGPKRGNNRPRVNNQKPPKNFGSRPPNNFGNRPSNNFGNRPPNNFGNRPPNNFGNRPPNNFGNRPPNNFGKRPNMHNLFPFSGGRGGRNPMSIGMRQNFFSQNPWRRFQNGGFNRRNNGFQVRNQQRPNFSNRFNMRPSSNRNWNQGRQNRRNNFSRPGRGPSSRGNRGRKG